MKKMGLLTFASTSVALKTERLLKDACIPCSVIPTPLEITADCGISLLLQEKWISEAEKVLVEEGCGDHTVVFPFERNRPQ
jgi:hypothetical protein